MRVLITGISGFVGPYVAAHIAEAAPEAELYGLLWGEIAHEEARLLHSVQLLPGDVTRPDTLLEPLEGSRPEVVVHLAAASSVARSWSNAAQALEVNAIGTVNLVEAILRQDLHPRIVVASSAEVYGRIAARDAVREDARIAPVSPYGISKAAQDLLAAQYGSAYGLPVVRLRPFHLTGPRRPSQFVVSSFAEQIARIERGLSPPRLAVGNLDAVRDITDVRDAARAYWLAADPATPDGAYNVCSGRPLRIGELLEMLLARTTARVEVSVDPGRLRAEDTPWLVGDHGRFTQATGWQPSIPLEQTLQELLDWWRQRLR